jgi:hypothetical protein
MEKNETAALAWNCTRTLSRSASQANDFQPVLWDQHMLGDVDEELILGELLNK